MCGGHGPSYWQKGPQASGADRRCGQALQWKSDKGRRGHADGDGRSWLSSFRQTILRVRGQGIDMVRHPRCPQHLVPAAEERKRASKIDLHLDAIRSPGMICKIEIPLA